MLRKISTNNFMLYNMFEMPARIFGYFCMLKFQEAISTANTVSK